MKSLKKILTQDKDLYEVQSNVDEVIQALLPIKIINSYIPLESNGIIKSFVITTSDTQINHGLNRPYQGYIIINRNANAVVYTSPTVNNIQDKIIILRASATVTVNILFF